MKLTESQKKLAEEVAEAAPSTEKAKEQLATEPQEEAPSYSEPREKTPEEMQQPPEAFLDRLDDATKPEGAQLSAARLGAKTDPIIQTAEGALAEARQYIDEDIAHGHEPGKIRFGKLLGSAGSLEQLKQIISQFFQSRNISLHDNGNGTWDVHNANGKISGVSVVHKGGRYRFEMES